ncbi:cation diffusion facilitator family transporter [Candidatus Nitrosocosmicus arcticus]|uniref:Putative Co/Zn/Cd cation transporter n=1 Tax=Candidatus Nitrosocosmicus arcticus TaxID=2035267 RepID=A0A557SVW9_9ARCH|nr:cation diffusion facilitator family transporter [Candidatus Nitrosocosmicus arcticus]TVP40757.1 putative Co/Zn/Cd cation transporter [Candidatus Nitrosocosmicus arcticus]
MVGAGESKKAIYAALFGNLAIAISKLIAALFTGSTSMWAETYHSFSDTFNQVLLLVGVKTSQKEANEKYPFGFGKEQFFWSFVVAILIFGVSGVLSLEHGISYFLSGHDTHSVENSFINYIILAIAFVFEANAIRIAFALFRKTIGDRSDKLTLPVLFTELKENKDPVIITVLVEDAAALLGIVIAAVALLLSDVTGNTAYDAIGSLLIGMVLMVFALFLARENRGMLIGEAMSKRDYEKINDAIANIPEVRNIKSIRTMHFAAEDVLIAIEVSLIENLSTDTIESVINDIENKIKEAIPYVNHSKIYVELAQESK